MNLAFWRILAVSAIGFCTAAFTPPLSAATSSDDEIKVNVQKVNGTIVVDASFSVEAPLATVWEVLTDYAAMPSYLPELKESRVVKRDGNSVSVHQRGETSVGPFNFSFDVVRGVEEEPMTEIRSRILRGSIKRSDGTATLSQVGNRVTVTSHNESEHAIWIPPGLGTAFIGHAIRGQYQKMRARIVQLSTKPAVTAPQ